MINYSLQCRDRQRPCDIQPLDRKLANNVRVLKQGVIAELDVASGVRNGSYHARILAQKLQQGLMKAVSTSVKDTNPVRSRYLMFRYRVLRVW